MGENREIHELDIVVGGVFPDENCVVRAEVVGNVSGFL